MADMNMAQAVRSVFSKYVTFSGRARRSEYWWFVLFNAIASLVVGIIDISLFGQCSMGDGAFSCASGNLLGSVYALATLLPGLAVWVRRLHDVDRSGWWWLILLIPLVGWIVLLVWACSRGTAGPNRFGTDPTQG